MSEALVNLSAMVGFEGVPLHLTYFPKLWLDIHHAQVKLLEHKWYPRTVLNSDYLETSSGFDVVLKVQIKTRLRKNL
jgi:hypothetical protein